MGFLNAFSKSRAKLESCPEGSFTLDKSGGIVTSTLPQSFPPETMRKIGQIVIQIFRSAQERQRPMREISIQYVGLRLTARDMRGGAMVFLSPRKLSRSKS
jgi:hypothetical protein